MKIGQVLSTKWHDIYSAKSLENDQIRPLVSVSSGLFQLYYKQPTSGVPELMLHLYELPASTDPILLATLLRTTTSIKLL